MKLRKSRCCVYALEYHVVWCVKYRRKVLAPDIEAVFFDTLFQYASQHPFTISEINSDQDHVHLLIQTPPTACLPQIIQGMKGVSARVLFQRFPQIKQFLWGGHLWSPSYYIATVSENTEQQIQRYIAMQKER